MAASYFELQDVLCVGAEVVDLLGVSERSHDSGASAIPFNTDDVFLMSSNLGYDLPLGQQSGRLDSLCREGGTPVVRNFYQKRNTLLACRGRVVLHKIIAAYEHRSLMQLQSVKVV